MPSERDDAVKNAAPLPMNSLKLEEDAKYRISLQTRSARLDREKARVSAECSDEAISFALNMEVSGEGSEKNPYIIDDHVLNGMTFDYKDPEDFLNRLRIIMGDFARIRSIFNHQGEPVYVKRYFEDTYPNGERVYAIFLYDGLNDQRFVLNPSEGAKKVIYEKQKDKKVIELPEYDCEKLSKVPSADFLPELLTKGTGTEEDPLIDDSNPTAYNNVPLYLTEVIFKAMALSAQQKQPIYIRSNNLLLQINARHRSVRHISGTGNSMLTPDKVAGLYDRAIFLEEANTRAKPEKVPFKDTESTKFILPPKKIEPEPRKRLSERIRDFLGTK